MVVFFSSLLQVTSSWSVIHPGLDQIQTAVNCPGSKVGRATVGCYPSINKINTLLYLASCRVIVFMGRKRPCVEVLGLISFAPSEVRSCPADSAGEKSNMALASSAGFQASLHLPGLPCCPRAYNPLIGKENVLKIRFKENNGVCIESGEYSA